MGIEKAQCNDLNIIKINAENVGLLKNLSSDGSYHDYKSAAINAIQDNQTNINTYGGLFQNAISRFIVLSDLVLSECNCNMKIVDGIYTCPNMRNNGFAKRLLNNITTMFKEYDFFISGRY